MKKRLKAPSPSMVVALIALVMAMGGTSIAAVNFARNAGAVDGRSAVSSTSSLRNAAGKLVATQSGGNAKGQIPSRFLNLSGSNVVQGRGSVQAFGTNVAVIDNSTTAAASFVSIPLFGTMSVICKDQNAAARRLDPQYQLTFTNQSGTTINYARSIDQGVPAIGHLANNAVLSTGPVFLNNSHEFRFNLQERGTNVVIEGVVRQDGVNTAAAACTLWGEATRAG